MVRRAPATGERAWPVIAWIVVLVLLLALAALTSPSLSLLPTYISYAVFDSLVLAVPICLAGTRSLGCLWLLAPLALLIIIAIILHANPLLILYRPLAWLCSALYHLIKGLA